MIFTNGVPAEQLIDDIHDDIRVMAIEFVPGDSMALDIQLTSDSPEFVEQFCRDYAGIFTEVA